MKTYPQIWLAVILMISACNQDSSKIPEVKPTGTAPKVSEIKSTESVPKKKFGPPLIDLWHKPDLTRYQIKILDNPEAFDEFCRKKVSAGEVYYHSNSGRSLYPCVLNSNGEWIWVPGGKPIPFLSAGSNIKFLIHEIDE